MKKQFRILSLILALILSLSVFVACGNDNNGTDTGSNVVSGAVNSDGSNVSSDPNATVEGTKCKYTITVEVVDDKGQTKTFTINTDETYLRGALEQEKLVEGEDGAYGLYIKKVDGISADYDTDGAYWALYEGDAYATTGVDGIELKDGGTYKLVYTKG